MFRGRPKVTCLGRFFSAVLNLEMDNISHVFKAIK
jgi:hypothetical protein